MTIGIDARFYNEAGPGRYVKNLLIWLEKIDLENNYVVFLKKSNFEEYVPKSSRFRKVLAPYHWYSLGEQLFFPSLIRKEGVDLMHFTQFNVPFFWFGKFVVTIHDMIIHEYPTIRKGFGAKAIYFIKNLLFTVIFKRACQRAVKILCPSESTKKDLNEKIGISAEKIVVAYEAVDDYFNSRDVSVEDRLQDENIIGGYGANSPYILYIGSMYPHKNMERLISAFKLLKTAYGFSGKLVLIGKESYFTKQLKEVVSKNGLDPEVLFPSSSHPDGYLSDRETLAFFRNARVYVFPSLKEGFGLSPLEAMALGIPVAVSNVSCMPEISGEAAIYFSPTDVEDMARKIYLLITDEKLREVQIKRGFDRYRYFSWSKMAEATLSVYRKV